MKYYDNTRISAYRTCPRLYYLRHVRHLTPEHTGIALCFGLAWHDAMDVVWPMLNKGTNPDDVLPPAMYKWKLSWEESGLNFTPDLAQQEKYGIRTPGIAAEMLHNYMVERKEFIQDCEILTVEEPFAVNLYPGSSDVKYVGRLDKVVRHPQHGIIIIEHKTTSAYAKASGFRSDYITSWSPNSQIDGYLHAGHMLYGKDVSGIWIDAALVHKTVHNKFRFIPIDRQFEQLDVWLHETRDWIKRIEDEKERADASPYGGYAKNTGNCSMYGGCAYRDICKFVAKPHTRGNDFVGYKVKKWEPFDVLKLEKLGLKSE